MTLRLAVLVPALLLLAGCSDSSGFLAKVWGGDTDQAVIIPDATAAAGSPAAAPPAAVIMPSAVPAAAPGAPDPFCASVAKEDSQQDAFDAGTQQKVAQQAYMQCVNMFGER